MQGFHSGVSIGPESGSSVDQPPELIRNPLWLPENMDTRGFLLLLEMEGDGDGFMICSTYGGVIQIVMVASGRHKVLHHSLDSD